MQTFCLVMETLKTLQHPLVTKPFKSPAFSSNLNCMPRPLLFPCKTSSSWVGPTPIFPRWKLCASPFNPLVGEDEESVPKVKKTLGVVVLPMERPRLVLKFISMRRVIGIAVDQVIAARGSIPLTAYLFLRKDDDDAAEQLKMFLGSKPWIPAHQYHLLICQATEIFKLWLQDNR